jgi:hypothetical protein
MKFLRFVFSALSVTQVTSTYTGLAISMDEGVLQTSKTAVVDYLSKTFSQLKLDDMDAIDDYKVTNLQI